MDNFGLQKVATFLLYDALSWMIKMGSDIASFTRIQDGHREDIHAHKIAIKMELQRRESEPIQTDIHCVICQECTDGRLVWGSPPRKPICPRCYWRKFQNYTNRFDGIDWAGFTNKMEKAIEMPAVPEKKETRQDIATRLGVPLEILEANGYFEG